MLIPFQCPNCKNETIEDVINVTVQPVCTRCNTFMEPWNGLEYKRLKDTKGIANVGD